MAGCLSLERMGRGGDTRRPKERRCAGYNCAVVDLRIVSAYTDHFPAIGSDR